MRSNKKDHKTTKQTRKKREQENISDAEMFINSITEEIEKINEMVRNGIPFEIVDESSIQVNKIPNEEDLAFLQDEEDMDDLDFDEMNDVWDEMDEEDEEF